MPCGIKQVYECLKKGQFIFLFFFGGGGGGESNPANITPNNQLQ